MSEDLSRNMTVTILLVDDDDVDAMGIERALKRLKIVNPVIRARDGVEGLALLREPKRVPLPYLILLDLNMPRMGGIEMLTELRQDPKLANSVVFVLTTSQADQDKFAAYEKNVAGYIVKNQVGDGFMRVIGMLDHYWRVVEMPATACAAGVGRCAS